MSLFTSKTCVYIKDLYRMQCRGRQYNDARLYPDRVTAVIFPPSGAARSLSVFASSKRLQSLGNYTIIGTYWALLCFMQLVRTLHQGAETWRPKVCQWCVLRRLEVINHRPLNRLWMQWVPHHGPFECIQNRAAVSLNKYSYQYVVLFAEIVKCAFFLLGSKVSCETQWMLNFVQRFLWGLETFSLDGDEEISLEPWIGYSFTHSVISPHIIHKAIHSYCFVLFWKGIQINGVVNRACA